MSPVEALGIVTTVAGRYAMNAPCALTVTFNVGEDGVPTARIDFADVQVEQPLEFDLLITDREGFRGLVELVVFKHRNPAARVEPGAPR